MTSRWPEPPSIIALWAVPRSTSTAFEKVIRQRGDLTCFHEPFGEVWHCGDDDRCPPQHRYDHRPGLTLQSRWADLRRRAREGPVFIKDFAHHVEPLMAQALSDGAPSGDSLSGESGSFLDVFRHSFLIRDPAKTLVSLHRRWPDFTLQEAGFADQRRLFDRVRERTGSTPPVIDSDDLLGDPDAVMESWCRAVGLPHLPEALEWEAGTTLETDWYDADSWHQTLDRSTGLSAATTGAAQASIAEIPELAEAYEACLPDYEHLYRHRS